MPLIQVKQVTGRSVEQKRALARELTDAYVRATGASAENIWVTIEDVPAESWAIGGTTVADGRTIAT
ncbi:4-oxalocrotonate tautomerase [Streptacidiphilus sp. MAP12-16]|uniref:2-hydroxymuconate tautomerase n=1 Tax=Streptacidiphilus sp. MAP12-16 TaxID=3156300 RepID=UPI003513F448